MSPVSSHRCGPEEKLGLAVSPGMRWTFSMLVLLLNAHCGGELGSGSILSRGDGDGFEPPHTGGAQGDGSSSEPDGNLDPDSNPDPEPDPDPDPPRTCCANGDCLCHGPDPTGLTSVNGPFRTATIQGSTGTIYFPTDAEPPFAGIAICAGFTNTGPEMKPWGEFYASHGFVTNVTSTGAMDQPATRARKLLAAIDELKSMSSGSGPLSGKLSDRYGTSGYSMGGGGTAIASRDEPTLRTSVGLAAWNPEGSDVQVPTLLLCGSSDRTAPCSMSEQAYRAVPESTPKMMISISGASHFDWFSPTNAGGGQSGEAALAFQKVFLAGDERWLPLLQQVDGAVTTNVP